mmetsp:Transcript_6398/g.19077  ORF Transcript_6398/g.19077 Transcript_6398/m.19077 type:complete len:300 (+) Transcript_6398:552-1451(+)
MSRIFPFSFGRKIALFAAMAVAASVLSVYRVEQRPFLKALCAGYQRAANATALQTAKHVLEGPLKLGSKCLGYFIDLGGNRGDTIDKFYSGYFNNLQGRRGLFVQGESTLKLSMQDLERVCVLSFEASPKWTKMLTEVREKQTRLGRHVFVYTETAIDLFWGHITLYVDELSTNGWATSTNPFKKLKIERSEDKLKLRKVEGDRNMLKREAIVKAADFTSILQVLSLRRKPIMIKMDIEGAEFKIIPHLLVNGHICTVVSHLFIEWHLDVMKNSLVPENMHENLSYLLTTCGVDVILGD